MQNVKPYIKRKLADIGCAIIIGLVFMVWCWIAFIPLSSLYSKVDAMSKDIKELKSGIEANLY